MTEYGLAQSHLHLELGHRGMVTVTVTLEPQVPASTQSGAIPPAVVRIIGLPFDLGDSYRISKRDDIEVSVLLNADDYCLLTVMAPKLDKETSIRIDNAFSLVDERAQNRVKFACDTSYRYLKQHRGVLSLPITISKFGITINLPRKYEIHQLSFEPARSQWTEDELGKTYTLPASSAAGASSQIWIAFPSPFEGGFHLAQFILYLIIGFIALVVEGRIAFERKLGTKTLVFVLVLTGLALVLTAYFFLTLAESLKFLAWAAGALIPIAFAPFFCIWLLIASRFEAEISGNITIDGERARYVTVSWYVKTSTGDSLRKQWNVKSDGSYRFFTWCGKGTRNAYIVASGDGTSRGTSNVFPIEARQKVHVPSIDIKRVQIRP